MLFVTENTVNEKFPNSQPEWCPRPVGVALPHTPQREGERGEQQNGHILCKVPTGLHVHVQ